MEKQWDFITTVLTHVRIRDGIIHHGIFQDKFLRFRVPKQQTDQSFRVILIGKSIHPAVFQNGHACAGILQRKRSGICVEAAVAFGVSCIIRKTVTPDCRAIHRQIPVGNIPVPVAFNDLDPVPEGTNHNAHMVCPCGAVAGTALVPMVENDITGKWNVAVVLLPGGEGFEEGDVSFTAAFCRQNLRQAALDGYSADKGGTPFILVLNRISTGQGCVVVIYVYDGTMGTVVFVGPKPAFGGGHNQIPPLTFGIRNIPGIAPGQFCQIYVGTAD